MRRELFSLGLIRHQDALQVTLWTAPGAEMKTNKLAAGQSQGEKAAYMRGVIKYG